MNISRRELVEMRRALLKWGRENFREFPWRKTREPYHILVSEVLLHRTRAEQVVPYYLEVIRRYPSVHDLAAARVSDLEELLRPLGLRWRVRMMHEMAREMCEKYSGRIPDMREELLSLPGVSDYIAGAVLCFAYGKPEPLLDTNTVRIISRVFGIPARDSSRRSRKFREIMEMFLDRQRPREFNYALIDLGATLCTARSEPHCDECPLKNFCAHSGEVRARA